MTITYIRIIGCILALVSVGCTKSSKTAPPKDQIREAVSAALPPFLAVETIETEPISTSPETVKVNFKLVVSPKEDLYIVDRRIPGDPSITLLKAVQQKGVKTTTYGFLQARRTMDAWSVDAPQIPTGLQQFGSPRGAFDALAHVAGSPEAEGAIQQQAANAAAAEREQKAIAERNEQSRKAFQEQREKEEQAARQKLLQATAPGVSYVGTIAYQNQRQRIRLIFTEQKGFLVRAEANNPDKPSERQTFSGELIFNPQPSRRSNDEKPYSIVLSPTAKQNEVSGRWEFYEQEGSLKLNLTDNGLEGEADIRYDYTVRLQKEANAASGANTDKRDLKIGSADTAAQRGTADAASMEGDQKALADKGTIVQQTLRDQRENEERAARQKLLHAAAPGVRYVGVISWRDQRQRIRLTFTEQSGFLLRAELTNTDNSSERRDFSGELIFTPPPEGNFRNRKAYSILLNPTGNPTKANGSWDIYKRDGALGLNLVENGLEGEAQMGGYNYELRLQKEGVAAEAVSRGSSSNTRSAETAGLTQQRLFPGERYPETRSRIIRAPEVEQWSVEKLKYAINEMYARYGLEFKDKAVSDQFRQFPWYRPDSSLSVEQIESRFTEAETNNVKLLGELRSRKR